MCKESKTGERGASKLSSPQTGGCIREGGLFEKGEGGFNRGFTVTYETLSQITASWHSNQPPFFVSIGDQKEKNW